MTIAFRYLLDPDPVTLRNIDPDPKTKKMLIQPDPHYHAFPPVYGGERGEWFGNRGEIFWYLKFSKKAKI